MTPKPKRKTDDELAREYFNALKRGRKAYEAADDALTELHARHEPGKTFDLPDGSQVELVDNFAEKNVAYKPCGVRRYDAKTHKPRRGSRPIKKKRS